MDKSDGKSKHYLSNNKRQHDSSFTDLHYYDLDLQFNPKRAHLDSLEPYSMASNGVDSRRISDGFQLFSSLSAAAAGGNVQFLSSKNSDYALNLSKKYHNFNSLPFSKSSQASPSLSYSPEPDVLPIDLSRGTRDEASSVKEHKPSKKKERAERPIPVTEEEKQKLIKQLQEELKIEESKLLLLKLIKRSQIVFGHNVKNGTALSSSLTATSSTSSSHNSSNPHKGQPSGTSKSVGEAHSSETLQKGYPGQTNNKSIHNSYGSLPHNMSSSSSTSQATNLCGLPSSSSSFGNGGGPSYSRSCTPQTRSTPSSTPGTAESSAQRQAAAKLALRRQLEKTLLQIPPPKPPPPEMNFIPNASSGDFVALLGLEEVVKCLIDSEARRRGEAVPEMKYVFNPFKCVQCSTDFTPVWKRDKPASKNVICERCVTTNQKRALKQEHTNRLKSAFMKALQQEQEIDKGSLQTTSSSVVDVSPLVSTAMADRHSLPPSLSSFLNPSMASSSHHKSFLSGDPLHRLTSDLASMSPLFSLPPSLWSLQNFPLGLSSSAVAAQALSQQLLFPFPGVLPKSDASHRQFLDLLPRKSQQQLDGSPLLWRS